MIPKPRFVSRRALSFAAAAAIHLALLFLVMFTVKTVTGKSAENPRVMKLADIREMPEPETPVRETVPDSSGPVAETMLESDDIPPQTENPGTVTGDTFDFLPMHLVSKRPEFPDDEIIRKTVYPPMAQRAGIEGTVILELFVDRAGVIRNISILKEDPPDRGFGEAAAKAFQGLRGSPALANGEAVASRYRYRYQFRLR
jgi:protein TonB